MEKPLYRKVISDLEKKIKLMKPNEKLPSERQMLATYGVSRNTIRLALTYLEERGLIYRLHGKGTFVSSGYLNKVNIGGMFSFSAEASSAGKKPSSQNISLTKVFPEQSVADQLNLTAIDATYCLTRLRLADGQPQMYSTTYLPEKIFPNLKMSDLNQDTLYSVMKAKYNQISVMAFEDLQAFNLNEEEAKLLNQQVGTASLKIYRKTINEKNIPIEFTVSLARGDTFVYRSKQYNRLD